MESLKEIFEDADIRTVLCYLTAGLPKKRYTRMLVRYYDLYCMMCEQWRPHRDHDLILTDFRRWKEADGTLSYRFLGVRDCRKARTFQDEFVNWQEVLTGDTEVFVPDCIMMAIDEDIMTTESLRRLEQVAPQTLPKRENGPLFESVREGNGNGKMKKTSMNRSLERIFSREIDRRFVHNEILEYIESYYRTVRWSDAFDDSMEDEFLLPLCTHPRGREILLKKAQLGDLPLIYTRFARLDYDNPPDLRRCIRRRVRMESTYEDIELYTYREVENDHMRIIIEPNNSCRKFPFVYIRDKYGNRIELSDIRPSKLLCMDIYVGDESIDTFQALAILLFYLEYPLRVKRIQKEYMVTALLGMKMKMS